MEKENLEEINYTMFKFIGDDNSIYDILKKYAGIEDLNTVGFLKWFKKYATVCENKHINKDWCKRNYTIIFNDLMDELRTSLSIQEKTNGIKPLSIEERDELLSKLQNIDQNKRKLYSIGQYIELAKETNLQENYTENGEIDPYYDELQNILLEKGVQVAREDELFPKIGAAFNILVINTARSNIRSMKLDEQVEKEELKKIAFIEKLLRKPDELKRYNEYLKRYYDEVEAHKEKVALKIECEVKREDYVKDELLLPMSLEEREISSKKGINNVVFRKSRSVDPKKGAFSWNVELSKNPELILDEMAEYSKNGVENQRVVAIDYGKFKYSTFFKSNGKPAFSSDNLHIVGVTRIGNDGVKNYFVMMPLEEMKLKKSSEVTQNDKRISFEVNDTPSPIMGYHDFEEYVFVETPKIPVSKKEYFSKVALSDYMLETATKENFRFAGYVKDTSKGIKTDASDGAGAYDLWAAQYARKNPGYCGKKRYTSLEDILGNPDLLYTHLQNVKSLYPEKQYSDSTVMTEKGSKEVSETFGGDDREDV